MIDNGQTVPYLPTPAYFREWVLFDTGMKSDIGFSEVFENPAINGKISTNRRGMARAMVAGAHGQEPVMLSVPVAGGASTVKRLPAGRWRISMHGRWPAMHFGALEAGYGATPFFRELADDLHDIYLSVGEGDEFGIFTERLRDIALDFISAEDLTKDWRNMNDTEKRRISAAARSMRMESREDLSFFDTIFRYGADAIFAILPLTI